MARTKREIQGLIFDFDGTLAELNLDFAAMRQGVHRLAREAGFGGDWPGGHLLEEIQRLERRPELAGVGFARRALELIQAIELEAAGRGRLFDFTRPMLARCRELGLGLAVVSRNSAAAIRRVFPDLEQAVDAFLPREAAPRPKPHPDHLLRACRRLRLEPDHCAMVGDHPTDLEAARAAGCLAVGVTSGRTPAAELEAAGAELVLPDASALAAVLEGMGAGASG